MLKKIWIPIVILFVILMGCVLFYGRHIAQQEPVKVYKPVAVEHAKAETPQTAEGGHDHADGTRHSETDAEDIAEISIADTYPDGKWYPENYTQADIEADLAGHPAMSDEEYDRRAYTHQVNRYIQEHREKYSDCQESAAVLEDAKRFAEWSVVDTKYTIKFDELRDEFQRLSEEHDRLVPPDPEERKRLGDWLRARPKQRDLHISKILAVREKWDAWEQRDEALEKEKPVYPKPRHTH